jgi:hypothetical protein
MSLDLNLKLPGSPNAPASLPHQLMEVASRREVKTHIILNLNNIIHKIEQNQIEQISQLEWVVILRRKAKWDEKNSRAEETAKKMWLIAVHHPTLRQRIVKALALYYSDRNTYSLAPSLVRGFSVFEEIAYEKYPLIIQVLQCLKNESSANDLVRLMSQYGWTPKQLRENLADQIPLSISAIVDVEQYIVPYFSQLRLPTQAEVKWLLNCLQGLHTTRDSQPDQQSISVNHLLLNVSTSQASPHTQLIQWLREVYSSYRSNSRWYKLTDQAKCNLQQWIGGVSYKDFSQLAEQIRQHLPLESKEKEHLWSRMTFWSHYSERFQGDLRILVPESSVQALAHGSFPHCNILNEDGNAITEVCIFNLGKFLVAELFRGSGNKTYIFQYSKKLEKFLFGDSRISVQDIRDRGGKEFDHAWGWQTKCVEYLEGNGISANPGTTEFRGLPPDCKKYTQGKGLPPLKPFNENVKETWRINVRGKQTVEEKTGEEGKSRKKTGMKVIKRQSSC